MARNRHYPMFMGIYVMFLVHKKVNLELTAYQGGGMPAVTESLIQNVSFTVVVTLKTNSIFN